MDIRNKNDYKKRFKYYLWLYFRFIWIGWLMLETFVFWVINRFFVERKHCTPVTDPLLLTPGIELAKKIRSREVKKVSY